MTNTPFPTHVFLCAKVKHDAAPAALPCVSLAMPFGALAPLRCTALCPPLPPWSSHFPPCACNTGGDSVSAVKQLKPVPPISYISTGGGASLELIRGTLLPGIKALAAAVAAQQPAAAGQHSS